MSASVQPEGSDVLAPRQPGTTGTSVAPMWPTGTAMAACVAAVAVLLAGELPAASVAKTR